MGTSVLLRAAEPVPKVIDVYARISKDYDGTTRSVDSQVADCLLAIEDREGAWRVGEVFRDHALSAWHPKIVRPSWERMMRRLETGVSDGVIVYDLTRFTRKPLEGERLIALAQRGVLVGSIENDYSLMDPDSRAHFRNDMTAAARESDKISQRASRGKRNKARRGKSNATNRGLAMPGREPRPQGWQPGDPEPPEVPAEQVAAEREIVRDLARRLVAGESLQSLARSLNARGIRTVTGHQWSAQNLRKLLRRPSLAGKLEYRGEIVGELPGEPALDAELWEQVQAVFASRSPGRPPSGTYLLSGLMTCSLCGHRLYGRPSGGVDRTYDDGERKRQYWCASGPLHGCGKLHIDQRYADAVVTQAVVEWLSDPANTRGIAKRMAQVNAARDAKLAEIGRFEEIQRGLDDRLARGEITFDRYDEMNAKLNDTLRRLRAELDEIGVPDEPIAVRVADAAADWAAMDVDEQRRVVRKAFPYLTLLAPHGHGAAGLTRDRFDFAGACRS